MSNGFPISRVQAELPSLLIDGQAVAPFAYVSYLPRLECYREAATCGIHLYSFCAYLAGRGINLHSGIGPFRKGIWRGEDEFDFSDLVTDMEKILASDTSARVIMRLHLDVPEWWERMYPQDCYRRDDGSVLRQSFTSPRWRSSVGEALRKIIQWFATSPYAPHLVGVHVAAGQTEEWFYHYRGRFDDRHPSRALLFDEFLGRKYPTLQARDLAWSESTIKDTAGALAALEAPAEQRCRDLRKDAAVLDACQFHSQAMVETIAHFCGIVKDASDGRLLTGVFYGYHFYVGDTRMGHTALASLLELSDLDYVASPYAYDRRPGLDWMPMAAVDSVRLHGKLWIAETDTRTALTRPLAEAAPEICPEGRYRGAIWEGPDSLEISAALLRANTARMLTHGYGGWWFDMWGGWYSHPALLAELAAAQDLWPLRRPAGDPRSVPSQTICVVVDGRIADYDASYGSVFVEPIYRNRYALMGCGRAWAMYVRDDLCRLDLSAVKMLWFLGVPQLTPSEQAIADRCLAGGATVLHTDCLGTRALGAEDQPLGLTISKEQLRDFADRAGVHAYLDSDDIVYVGSGFIAVHAATAGEKRLHLPGNCRLIQVMPKPANPDEFAPAVFAMDQYQTVILRIEPAQ